MNDVVVRELISAADRDAAYVLRHRICVDLCRHRDYAEAQPVCAG